ncbi:MAG: hypothetical protein ACREBR_05105 [bacterium]
MSLTRIQRTFARLAAVRRGWIPMGSGYRNPRRKRVKQFPTAKIRVELIDAVTGQKTSGKGADDSPAKLKKWLKLRNVRAEFVDILIKKNSIWSKLQDVDFIDYPIIVKVGTYKAPYLIKRVENRKTIKGKTTCSMQLETTGNVDYLSILSKKKELLENKKKSK